MRPTLLALRRRASVLAGLACVSILVPTAAHAADLDAAKEASERAERARGEGRWCDAAKAFVEVFEQSDDARALFNSGIAAQKGGHRILAVDTFDRFRELAGESPLRAKAADRATSLRAEIASEGPGAPCELPPKVVVTPPPPKDPEVKPDDGTTKPDDSTDEPRRGEHKYRTAGWILVGVGGAALLAGGGFTLSAMGTASDIEASVGGYPPPAFDQPTRDRHDSFARDNTIGAAGLISGAVIATAGGVLLYLDSRSSR